MTTSKVRATSVPPTDKIKAILPSACTDSAACELILQVGVFFDGTGNNRDSDAGLMRESNIARLYLAYPESRAGDQAKIYIPGVGTPFDQVGELEKTTMGGAFGVGGEARLIVAFLQLANIISFATLNKSFFTNLEITALCSKDSTASDNATLLKFGLQKKLVKSTKNERKIFFKEVFNKLKNNPAAKDQAKIKEIFFDIFGFSRGAAAARVFANWLMELMDGTLLAGVPCILRFLGILDTVASVGVMGGAINTVINDTDGHGVWALSPDLRISPEIKNCVHMVAMHELRKNFPLDMVAVDEFLPANCEEVAYPGSHSDIGGGYEPGELGISVGADRMSGDFLKLSQIPLNHMYECAIAAGVPLLKDLARRKGTNLFKVDPQVTQAFNDFLKNSPSGPQLMSDWMQPFLNWRWSNRKNYKNLEHVRLANEADKKLLFDSNEQFIADAERMAFHGDADLSREFVRNYRAKKFFSIKNPEYKQNEMTYLDPEAWEVRQRATDAEKNVLPPVLSAFFDRFVHDSLAGFRKQLVEKTGYWRYRKIFRGYDNPGLAQESKDDRKIA